MKAKIDLSLIEPRTFLLTVIFSFVWGFKKQLDPIIPVILHDFYNYSSLEIAVIEAFLNGIWFLLIILLFVAFFYICNRNFINKIGSTIISAVVGNVIGFWVGYLVTAGCVMFLMPTIDLAPFASVSISLVWEVASLLLYEFAAIASAFLVKEWNRKLEQVGFTTEDMKMPGTVLVAFILYVIFGAASLILAPMFAVSGQLMSGLTAKLRIFMVSTFLVNGVAELAIGYGLYNGKRWGWLFAFISSTTGVIISISLLIAHMTSGFIELWMLIGLIIALLLNLIILACLLPANTRKYFRFLNFENSQNQ